MFEIDQRKKRDAFIDDSYTLSAIDGARRLKRDAHDKWWAHAPSGVQRLRQHILDSGFMDHFDALKDKIRDNGRDWAVGAATILATVFLARAFGHASAADNAALASAVGIPLTKVFNGILDRVLPGGKERRADKARRVLAKVGETEDEKPKEPTVQLFYSNKPGVKVTK